MFIPENTLPEKKEIPCIGLMKDKVFKILVVHHKKDKVYRDDIYTPIQAGKALSDTELDMIGDDTGDNISDRNPYYCELTALYWAWKNLKGVDYIGLCHYRRYFDFHGQISPVYHVKKVPAGKMDVFDFTLPEKEKKRLMDGEVIVSVRKTMNKSVFKDYCRVHVGEDLYLLRKALVENSSDLYVKAFDSVMLGNRYSPYNMFVMSWTDFDNYCSWLFNILFRLEPELDLSSHSKYQQRVFGFMAERLLNVFLTANGKKLDTHPVVMFHDNTDEKSKSVLKQVAGTMIKRIQFAFNQDKSGYRKKMMMK